MADQVRTNGTSSRSNFELGDRKQTSICLPVNWYATHDPMRFRPKNESVSLDWQTGQLIAHNVRSTSAASDTSELDVNRTEERIDHLIEASLASTHTLRLRFADKTFVLAIEKLEMPVEQFDWSTVKAAPTGEKMTVSRINGRETTPIDVAMLRYLVDQNYAAKIDRSIADLHIPIAEAKEATRRAKAAVDPRWKEVCDDDLLE